ncbi:MAG: cyanophycin synthetase, partial [Nostocoides sp.]
FEVIGTPGGVTVVEDYAHNAGKVTALVRTAVELVGADHVHVVFQPHLFSRTRDFAEGFGAGLAAASDVVLLPIYGAREDPMPGVTSELVAKAVRRHNPKAQVEVEADRAAVVAGLVARSRPGDLVLIVGAGDVTTMAPLVLAALGAQP